MRRRPRGLIRFGKWELRSRITEDTPDGSKGKDKG